jgi:ABC-type uncharacterized transport system permease subunit
MAGGLGCDAADRAQIQPRLRGSDAVHGVFTTEFAAALLTGAIVAGMPLLLAGLGETVSEQAGVLNIGLEGMMLVGAYAGFVVAHATGAIWLGFLAAILAGMAVSGIVAILCVRMGRNQIVVGVAILVAAEGVTSLLQAAQFGKTYPRLGAIADLPIPILSKIPVVGPSVFSQPPIVYLGIVLVAVVHRVLFHTTWGLNVRAAGWKPVALDDAGVSVPTVRTLAVLTCGALAGLGGGYLSIVGAGVFVAFMTGGQGFIAIVIAMLGRGRPVWVAAGAFLFGIALSISTALQLVGVSVSTDVVQMLPFVAVILALVVFARQAMLPAALAMPFERGHR